MLRLRFSIPFIGVIILQSLIPTSVSATQPYYPKVVDPLSESWRWKHFQELDGKGVRFIYEGNDNRVWVTFNDGIYEYNGYSWKLHNNTNGLASIPNEQVYAASDGLVYATAPKGIFRYDGEKWESVFSIPDNLTLGFRKIRELSNGSLMFSCDYGVIHIKNDKKVDFYTSTAKVNKLTSAFDNITLIRLPEKASDGGDILDVSDILEDNNGQIWFAITLPEANEGKLLRFSLPKIATPFIADYIIYETDKKLAFGEDQKLIQASDQSIWVINTSNKTGINIFDGANWKYVKLGEIFGGDEYAADIVESTDGTIWIGSLGKLYSYKNSTWQIYSAPDFKIPANKLMLYKSKGNKLWITGFKSNVYLLDYSSGRWITYAGLNYQCEKNNLEQWFLDVEGRVVVRRGENWEAFTTDDGLMDAPVRIIITSQGQIWAAGSHGGAAATAYLKNGKWIKQVHPRLSWGIDYRAVFEAKDGTLWFGGGVDSETDKGQIGGVLQLLNPTESNNFKWIHHKYHENGLLQSNSYGIAQSVDGTIWMGGGSLYYYNGSSWNRPAVEPLRQYINIVYSTKNLLLVGSRYYGIFIYDGKDWKNFDSSSGLANNTIISIDAISDSCIWVATESDICRFDGQNWVNNIFPTEMNMDFEGGSIFHSSDGAIWINKSSRSWKRRAFTHNKTREKICRNFVTYRYIADKTPPETEITIYDDEVSEEGNVLIRWEGTDFFAESPSEKLLYSYRLNGGEWSPFTAEENHTFFSLGSGRYILEVRARDIDMNVDPTPARVEFKVLPPVWKQAWFITLVSAFLLIVGIYEFRVISKKQKLEKLNSSLQSANDKLKKKSRKIISQNQEILLQQEQILKQKLELEKSYKYLEDKNLEIKAQRDKLEEMVGQIEEMSKSKLIFFTNISHELRTPLTLILGPLEQLRNPDYTLAETEKHRLYEIINRNASRLLKLINQLLEIRKIENGSMSLKPTHLNLHQFICGIKSLFDNLAVERDIQYRLTFNSTNNTAAVDPDKLEKIIVNLLSNAFKHTPETGHINIIVDEVPAGAYELPLLFKKYFKITVSDSGKGIAQGEREQIFERYYQSDPLKNGHLSSGIGLSYIKELVEIHQGKIKVESTEGKGTNFHIFLPIGLEKVIRVENSSRDLLALKNFVRTEIKAFLSQVERDSEKPAPSIDPHQLRNRILVVDDNPDMTAFLDSLLGNTYQIIKTQNGNEALELAKNHSFDLIISDIMMPGMGGLEFCDKVKSNIITSHIPVILLTARVLEEHKMDGYLTGADDYITKPFNPDMLRIRVENLLKQREKLREKFNRDFLMTPKEVILSSPDEEFLKKLVEIMEENLDCAEFNVNRMCEMVHLSHMHFIRKVKQFTGKTPLDLLKSFRLKRAKDLLLQNKLTVAEIAYKVGYDLPNSFSRAFKKEFGLSPTEFIDSLEKDTCIEV